MLIDNCNILYNIYILKNARSECYGHFVNKNQKEESMENLISIFKAFKEALKSEVNYLAAQLMKRNLGENEVIQGLHQEPEEGYQPITISGKQLMAAKAFRTKAGFGLSFGAEHGDSLFWSYPDRLAVDEVVGATHLLRLGLQVDANKDLAEKAKAFKQARSDAATMVAADLSEYARCKNVEILELKFENEYVASKVRGRTIRAVKPSLNKRGVAVFMVATDGSNGEYYWTPHWNLSDGDFCDAVVAVMNAMKA